MHFTVNTRKNPLHSVAFLTESATDCAVMSYQIRPGLTVTSHDTARALSTNPGVPVLCFLHPSTTDVTWI